MLTIEGMTEVQALAAEPGLVQELAQIEIELGVTSVRSRIFLQRLPHI